MFINKKYKTGDIVAFKLITAEEVIGKYIEENSEGFVIDRPCTIIPSSQGIGLIQTLLTADIDTEVTLQRGHVLMHGSVVDSIKDHYVSTTTGVAVTHSGGIIVK